MLKHILKFTLVSVAVFGSINVYAERVTTGWFKIQQIQGDSNGPMVIKATSGTANGCYGNGDLSFYVGQSEMNQNGYNLATSLAMTAFMHRYLHKFCLFALSLWIFCLHFN